MNSRITLQELQMVEVNVLNEFIKFCDDNDLKYFVVYGTLLGTIRHNGIIPWDDDIDVCMVWMDLGSQKRINFIKSQIEEFFDYKVLPKIDIFTTHYSCKNYGV